MKLWIFPNNILEAFKCLPMKDVPTEIWGEIFEWALIMERERQRAALDVGDMTVIRRKKNDSGAYHPPFTFLYVCKRWYDVATGHSVLWTHLAVPLHPGPRVSDDRLVELLSMSHGRPLTIDMLTMSRNPSLPIAERVLEERSRIQSLTFSLCPYEELVQTVFRATHLTNWYSLKTLQLTLFPASGSGVPNRIDLHFLPALKSFTEIGGSDSRTDIILPWHSLETIHLHLTSDCISTQLEESSLLTTLDVMVDDDNHYVDIDTFFNIVLPSRKPYWPNVRRARFRYCPFLVGFIGGHQLETFIYEATTSTIRTEFRTLLHQASGTLRHFHMVGPMMWEDGRLRQAVWGLEKLEELKIDIKLSADWSHANEDAYYDVWTDGVAALLNGLTEPGTRFRRCPHLETCEVRFSMSGALYNKGQRKWLGYELRKLVCRIREPMCKLWLCRSRGLHLESAALSWRVGDQGWKVSNDALLNPNAWIFVE